MTDVVCDWSVVPCISAEEARQLNLAQTVGCALSIFLTAIVLLGALIFPEKRAYPARLGCFLALSSHFVAWSVLITTLAGFHAICPAEVTTTCFVQGLGIQFFGSSLIFWWFNLCLNLYSSVHTKGSYVGVKMEVLYHFFGWGFPFVFALVPACARVYLFDGTFCWIDSNDPAWVFGAFYGPMGIVYFIGFGLYCRVLIEMLRLRRIARETNDAAAPPWTVVVTRYARHHVFVIGLFILSVPLYVAQYLVFGMAESCDEFPSLYFVQRFVIGAQGIFVGLVFLSSQRTLLLWKRFFARLYDANYDAKKPAHLSTHLLTEMSQSHSGGEAA